MEPEPVRQFVSKAARRNARAAFELCAPVNLTSGNEPKSRTLSRTGCAGHRGRGDPPHRPAPDSPRPVIDPHQLAHRLL